MKKHVRDVSRLISRLGGTVLSVEPRTRHHLIRFRFFDQELTYLVGSNAGEPRIIHNIRADLRRLLRNARAQRARIAPVEVAAAG